MNLRVNFSVDFWIVISKLINFSYAMFGVGFIEGKWGVGCELA